MTPEFWQVALEWVRFGVFIFTALLGVVISALVRKPLSYFPAVKVLAVTAGLKGLFYAFISAPWLPEAITRDVVAEMLVQLLIIGGLLWTLVLVVLQNRCDSRAIVDIDARVHPITPEQARAEASRKLRLAGEIERASGYAPPTHQMHQIRRAG